MAGLTCLYQSVPLILAFRTPDTSKWPCMPLQDPVDLQLIMKRLRHRDYYLTLDIFKADIKRMLNNCRLYNSAETVYFQAANG